MYSISVDPKIRNALIKFFSNNNIETRVSFPPIHIQPFFVEKLKRKRDEFPNAIASFESFIDIPIWADMGPKNQSYVMDTIINFFNQSK